MVGFFPPGASSQIQSMSSKLALQLSLQAAEIAVKMASWSALV